MYRTFSASDRDVLSWHDSQVDDGDVRAIRGSQGPHGFAHFVPPPWDIARVLDVGVGLVALVLFAPLMLGIALTVYLSRGGPVFFRQERVGRGGQPFTVIKFRTMRDDAEQLLAALLAGSAKARQEWERDHKLRHDPRVVGFGNVLRRYSLDELPQLFNVLKGEMSIVGPRPITRTEAIRYGRYMHDYCRVRPGLTGLWQVKGRSTTTYRRRVACDVAYARSKSAWNDLRIIALTIPVVLFARGAY